MKKISITFLVLGLIINLTQAQEYDLIEAKYRGKPIIEMTLNNKKTWFLLDTGSDFTVLDTSAKNKYDFKTSHSNDPRLNVPGFGSKNNQLAIVHQAKIRFGNVLLKGTTFAFDLSTVAKSIQNRTGKRISGIIGTSMMKDYGFVIDMRNGTASMLVKRKKIKAPNGYGQEMVLATKNEKLAIK